eukprot:26128_1
MSNGEDELWEIIDIKTVAEDMKEHDFVTVYHTDNNFEDVAANTMQIPDPEPEIKSVTGKGFDKVINVNGKKIKMFNEQKNKKSMECNENKVTFCSIWNDIFREAFKMDPYCYCVDCKKKMDQSLGSGCVPEK